MQSLLSSDATIDDACPACRCDSNGGWLITIFSVETGPCHSGLLGLQQCELVFSVPLSPYSFATRTFAMSTGDSNGAGGFPGGMPFPGMPGMPGGFPGLSMEALQQFMQASDKQHVSGGC